MRRIQYCISLVVSLVAFQAMVSSTHAQTQASINAAKYGIAVVDISYIFKNHQRFKSMMEQLKVDMQNIENVLREDRKKIAQLEEQLKQVQAGSPDFKQMDERIAKEKADFNLKATKQRKDFMDREAKIYYQAYLEVNDAVKYYAQRQGLGLVLRFNGDPIDPNGREEIVRGISNPVVYQNGIDITPNILEAVNRDGGQVPPGARIGSPPIPGRQR